MDFHPPSPPETLWKFCTKKTMSADVAPPGASKSMRREEPSRRADIRKTV